MKWRIFPMSFDALGIFVPACFCMTVFAITRRSGHGNARPPAAQSPAGKRGLDFVVGPRGLDSLSYNGQSLLVSPESGELQPQKSVFRAVLDALLPRSSPPVATPNKQADTVDLSYPWGRISCAYGKQDDRLTMRIEVSNTSSEPLNEFSLRLMELNFPRVPKGGTLEAGMFGFGFKGPEWPLDRWPASIPSVADPLFVVPIVRVDFGTGALNFCSDDLECSVGIPHSTNPPDRNQLSVGDHVPRYQAGRNENVQCFAALRPGRCRGARSLGRRSGTVRREVSIPGGLERSSPNWRDLSGRPANQCARPIRAAGS